MTSIRYKYSYSQLFIVACLLSVLFVFLGLRIFFNDTRLEKQLTKTYSATTFDARIGDVRIDNSDNSLLVFTENEQSDSRIERTQLMIDTRIYERAEILFIDKPSLQTLDIYAVGQRLGTTKPQTAEQAILYTDNQAVSRFELDRWFNHPTLINTIGIKTSRLAVPYRLQAIRFLPKKYDIISFAKLIWYDISAQSRYSLPVTLLSIKRLLLIYFMCVLVAYIGLLFWAKKRLVNAWWWVLIVAWLLIDGLYLLGRAEYTWQRLQGENATYSKNTPSIQETPPPTWSEENN